MDDWVDKRVVYLQNKVNVAFIILAICLEASHNRLKFGGKAWNHLNSHIGQPAQLFSHLLSITVCFELQQQEDLMRSVSECWCDLFDLVVLMRLVHSHFDCQWMKVLFFFIGLSYIKFTLNLRKLLLISGAACPGAETPKYLLRDCSTPNFIITRSVILNLIP